MFFLCPDHVIGKRESRRIREEHNATVNQLLAEREELINAVRLLVKDLSQWPGEKNPEFFPSMKAGRELLKKNEPAQ